MRHAVMWCGVGSYHWMQRIVKCVTLAHDSSSSVLAADSRAAVRATYSPARGDTTTDAV